MIKAGYLVSYDYRYIFTSLNQIYKHVDLIVLCYDKNFKTWSGSNISIPEEFFIEIKNLDVDDKIKFYKDEFYKKDIQPMVLETEQRNKLAKFMGDGGWHIQIDADEHVYEFDKFITFLKQSNHFLYKPHKNPVNINVKWITLFKQDENGFYLINPIKESCYLATNYPKYTFGRKTEAKDFFSDHFLIHQSWAREEEEIYTKITNWGHKNDFDIHAFFDVWKKLNETNYKEYVNFHPVYKNDWASLKFIEAPDLDTCIQKIKTSYEQNDIKFKFSRKIKSILKSYF